MCNHQFFTLKATLFFTFLSRLEVTKYLLSGLQSHDQMIRLCTAVSFLVCAYRENWGSAWIQQTQTSTEIL